MTNTELIRNTKQTIGVTASLVSEEQYGAQRSVIFIVNTSTAGQSITVTPSDEAKVGEGIVLGPGGYYQDSIDSGYKPTNARITAISSAAGGTIAIHERIIMGGI